MRYKVAALWGTTVGYSDYGSYVTIETIDSRVAALSKSTFNFLYHKLDDFTAALKGECIEYRVMSLDPDMILVKNYKGDERYMDAYTLARYYDILGE